MKRKLNKYLFRTLNMTVRGQNWVSCFVTLSWTSAVTYFLIGQLLDREGHKPKQLNSNINFASSLMHELGFIGKERYYPQSYHDDVENLPVFLTAVNSEHYKDFFDLLYSFRVYFLNGKKKLVVYNLDLSAEEKSMAEGHCQCQLREIDWFRFPDHIRNLKLGAYIPLLIKEALQEFGVVFWISPESRFKSGQINVAMHQAEQYGLVSWPIQLPTSALTHYNMFRYFNESHKDYYFHRMARPDQSIFFNTETMNKLIMLPWIQCVLDYECLAPIGSQPSGCNFVHKPRYIYSGCHRYAMSAFNVILGKVFQYETHYIAKGEVFEEETDKSKDSDISHKEVKYQKSTL